MKNSKGEIVDIKPYIDVDIKEEIILYAKFIEELHEKLYEVTKVQKDRLKKLH